MEKVQPDNFKFSLGGFSRTSWQVSWEGGKLLWRKFGPEWQELTCEEIEPSDEQWVAFWTTLDESRIWSWDEAYYTEATRAGEDLPEDASIEELAELSDNILSWAVEILLKDGRYIDSSGSNAVPGQTAKARASRQRRRRGGRSRRPQKPEAEVQESAGVTAIMLADSNAGIPDNTFDLFLEALKTLIQGRELGDEEQIPEAVETSFRGRTEKKRSKKSPLEVLEAETGEATRSRKKRRTLRRRDGSGSSKSETTRTTRKRSGRRRKGAGRPADGETVGTEGAGTEGVKKKRRRRRRRSDTTASSATGENKPGESGGENRSPARRRRRRRPAGSGSKPAGSGSTNGPSDSGARSAGGGSAGGQPARGQQAGGEGAPKKRRRRRRRRPGGKGDSAPASGGE